jgi:hypothetical protein
MDLIERRADALPIRLEHVEPVAQHVINVRDTILDQPVTPEAQKNLSRGDLVRHWRHHRTVKLTGLVQCS